MKTKYEGKFWMNELKPFTDKMSEELREEIGVDTDLIFAIVVTKAVRNGKGFITELNGFSIDTNIAPVAAVPALLSDISEMFIKNQRSIEEQVNGPME